MPQRAQSFRSPPSPTSPVQLPPIQSDDSRHIMRPPIMSFRRTRGGVFSYIDTFLFSLNSVIAQGIFTACAIALMVHKITVMLLYAPFPIFQIILYGPFLFSFDFLTLVFLHRALASGNRGWQILAGLVCLVIISCSASFVSLYLEANAEINWGRSVEVVPVNPVHTDF